jgi:two-component system, LytTR family, response regulator
MATVVFGLWMKLTTLIAEDELRTRNDLHGLCARRPELDVVAQVDCGAAAVSAIESIRPELLLLDADLPDMGGMEVLRTVHTPEAPFTALLTNREQLQSGGAHSDSVGYLAKPVERRQFDELIDTAIARRSIGPQARRRATTLALAPPSPRAADGGGAQLIGERAHRFYFLDAHTVDFLEVDGNYVTIHVGEGRFLTRTTLRRLASVLAPHDFIVIDRSLLINLRQVDYAERLESGQIAFTLRHGQRLTSSRERASDIVKLLRSGVR